MAAYGRRVWLRSRKIMLCLVTVALLLGVYFLIDRDPVLDQKLARSSALSERPFSQTVKAPGHKPTSLNAHRDLTNREDIIAYIERRIQDALKVDKGMGCDIPKLDPFAAEVTRFDKVMDKIVCNGIDWVSCKFDKCQVKKEILDKVSDIRCHYRDIVYVSDAKFYLGEPTAVVGSDVYRLVKSDQAEVICSGKGALSKWEGLVIGFRDVKLKDPPPGRERAYNILILGFDSTSKNGFIRRMPRSYKVLRDELGAVILNGYNIVGDGTPAALFPILTGYTELELPEVRRRVGSERHLDTFPFLWYTLGRDGYRTAYFEDSPWIGTFQYRFTGFLKQPTDHYLRPFFQQYHNNVKRYSHGNKWYCVGDTPSHALMMNLTRQFMHLDSTPKKFIFTFIADITHDDFNFISNADERLEQWLRAVRDDGTLDDTLLVLMGDHGPRYANVRNTLQGKQEERLPLMSFVLPKSFVQSRPEALDNLRANADVLTTPFDLHNTLLELVGLTEKQVHKKIEGTDLPRSMSLFHKIPSSRSCSEAGIEPHWCSCLEWEPVAPADDTFGRAGRAFLDYINGLTLDERSKCIERTLTTIESVSRRTANPNLLAFKKNKDVDGYVGSFDARMKLEWNYYQVKIVVGPGTGIYEGSLSYDTKTKKFHLTTRDISRINAYNNEPSCISATRPDLNMYCYCKT